MKRVRLIAICLMFALSLSGCGQSYRATVLTDSVEKQSIEETELDQRFYQGQMAFSLKLLQKAAEQGEENILLSPLSVATALAMAANGADGKTAEEMLSVLGGYSLEELNAYLYTWKEALPSDDQVNYHDANSIWIRDVRELQVHDKFLQANADHYDAQVFKAEFDDHTLRDINRWVDENTNGMIPEFLQEIERNAMLILLNAIAFDAKWQEPYEDADIQEKPFTALNGEEQTAQMMNSTEETYLENDSATGFLRPYNEQYSFGALLPKDAAGFEQYIQDLTAEELIAFIETEHDAQVEAHLPKFSNEYCIELKELLIDMGMPSAFDATKADFGKMAEMPLYINKALHQTAIDVDRSGTKAAAVTGLMYNGGSSFIAEKKTVVLDRPFLYFILDTETDLPIFIGTVTSL